MNTRSSSCSRNRTSIPFTLPVGIQFLSSTSNSHQPAISAGLDDQDAARYRRVIFFQR